MTPPYKVIPTGGYDGTPPLESEHGAYFYKYSYFWTCKSASTEVDLRDTVLKFDNRSDNTRNNAYVFLACIGTSSTPAEFGIIAPYNADGEWRVYTRNAGENVKVQKEVIFEPDKPIGSVYTYKNSEKITIKITLSGTDIIGTIYRDKAELCRYTVQGKEASIGQSATHNTFMLGTSFVPIVDTTSPGGRNAYFEHVYLRNGLLYSGVDYRGEEVEWVPDKNNPMTYYAVLCYPDYITYNRFGTTDEEISINYNK